MTELTNKGARPSRPAAAFAERLAARADRVSLALLEHLSERAAAATRAVSSHGVSTAPPEHPSHASTAAPPLKAYAALPRAATGQPTPDTLAPGPTDPTPRHPPAPKPGPSIARRVAETLATARQAASAKATSLSTAATTRLCTTSARMAIIAPAIRTASAPEVPAPPAPPTTPAARRRRIQWPSISLPRPAWPNLTLPRVTLPRITLPTFTAPTLPSLKPPRPHAHQTRPEPPTPLAPPSLSFAPADEAAPPPGFLSATNTSAGGAPPPHSLAGQLEGRSRGPSAIIWLTGAGLGVFTLWAAFAPVDEIVRAEGEIVSSSRPQIIQNLEGGILAELMVAEGDIVAPGDRLARLEGTAFRTNVDDLDDQIAAAEIRRLRLEAEMAGLFDVALPDALATRMPEIAASERALLAARQSDYVARTDGARAILAQAEEERDILEALWEDRIVALIEVTRARKAFSDAQATLDEIVTQAELERAAEYSETLKDLASLRQQLRLSTDQLRRTILTSPLKGTINRLTITTIGGVVRPGEEILQIVPLGEELFVEARVRPRDIGHIRAGQEATIKLTAYDYTIYGSLSGRVRFVSADTFRDEVRPDAEPHFRATIAVDRDALTPRQRDIAIRPGMQAEVELHTGAKTVLQYLTRPLNKAREALREP